MELLGEVEDDLEELDEGREASEHGDLLSENKKTVNITLKPL